MEIIKLVRNSAGIGLVEVMMAVAVTGGLTLTIAKLMDNASQSAKQVEAKSENTNLKGLVQDVLNNTTACKNTFGLVMTPANVAALSASTTATVTIPNIKDKLNTIKYSTASTNIKPLYITSIEITNYNALAYTGDLIINSTFKKSSSIVMMVKPIRIPINFSFTSGSLTACSTMAVGGEWLLGGNAGTVDGADYVGTSDTAPLNFKVNAQKSGRIEHVYGQTFFGYQAGMNQLSTNDGTAFGFQASKSNTTGINNSSFGWVALRDNSTGSENSAFGNRALYYNSTGSHNSSFGANSMAFNRTGVQNTAVGGSAMYYSTTGNNNTAIGFNSLMNTNNTSGSNNTSLGSGAGSDLTTGSNNLFLGWAAGRAAGAVNSKLYIETTGNTSPLIGGDFSTTGRYVLINSKLGVGVPAMTTGVTLESYGSGAYIRGIPNFGLGVAISANFGNIVSPPQFTAATEYEILKLGGNLRIAGVYNGPPRSQQIVFGNAAGTEGKLRWYEDSKYWEFKTPSRNSALVISDAGNIGFGGWPEANAIDRMSFFPATGEAFKDVGGDWTANSDGRLKKNIKNLDGALNKISKLRPVSYGWKNEHLHSVPNGDTGFIAQEVEKIFPLWVGETETKSDDRLFLPKGAKVKNITLPIGFNAYLVKAIQELNEQVIKNQEMFQVMHDGLEEQVKANTKAIVALEEEVKDLKLENKKLKDRLKRIERALNIQ